MDNQKDTLVFDQQTGDAQLPFHDFFTVLKKNGFAVTTQQVIDTNRIIINYSAWVKNEEGLCLHLLPIFATDEDQQVLFRQLFFKYFNNAIAHSKPAETRKEIFQKNIKRNWKKILVLYGLLAVLLVAFIIFKYQQYTRPDPAAIKVSLVDANSSTTKVSNTDNFSVTTNQPLVLNTVFTYAKQKDRFTFTGKTKINWGDNSITDDKNSHSYTSPGKYNLVAYVEVLHNYKIIKRDTLHRLVLVCNQANTLKVDYGGNNQVPVNKSIQLKASTDPLNPPDYIKWVNNGVDLLYGNRYQARFSKPGSHTITCIAVYDSINSPCTIRQNIIFIVPDSVKAVAKPASENVLPGDTTNTDETPKKTSSPFLFYLYLWLAIIFGILAILFLVLSEKEKISTGNLKKAVLERYQKLSNAMQQKKLPAVLPFRNKNYLPLHQTEINNAARLMRKRVNDNSSYLHIDKTIAESIKNSGLFQPVMVPRTRQTEYLVLINEVDTNSQQVKLYEYLLQEFKKQNILTAKYYYRSNINYLYNFVEPKGISLEKLFTRYPNHILLIFGNAYQLINKLNDAVDIANLALINRWQYKAVLTPVSYPDWGAKEKDILLPNIPVFPLDVEGILLMAEQLAGTDHPKDILSRLNQHRSIFYKTKGINFIDIESLEKYCDQAKWAILKEFGYPNTNILFQWIAALAVHPKLSWDVIITIGKAILDRYDCGHELNFSNLLRIARISWMNEGVFPNAVRMGLLQKLTIENEKLARETMLLLLQEIPASEMKEGDPAQQEKEVQQIIHEFSLYAHDPVFYTSYKESGYLFKKLWDEKKLNDTATESYFSNTENKWSTLLNSKTSNNNEAQNVGIEEYFETLEKEDTLLSKFYLWLGLISVFVFVSSLFALRILYQWKTATDV